MSHASQQVSRIEERGREVYKNYAPYRVSVPPGKSGEWTIDQFETEMGIGYLRHARDGREPGIGTFTRLTHKQYGVVMSDTAAEIDDLKWYLKELQGNVLITGLGLGMVVHALTTIPRYSENVKSITVVEASRDVIQLSAKHYESSDPRVCVVHADAYEWLPSTVHGKKRFDSAWHDIWNDLSEDNKPLFAKMRRHYQPYMRLPKKQFCWGEAYIRSLR